MNIPSTLGGNWVWRLDGAALTDELADKLKTMSEKADDWRTKQMGNIMEKLELTAQSMYCKRLKSSHPLSFTTHSAKQ